MPWYDLKCNECGSEFETNIKHSDLDNEIRCSKKGCKGVLLRQINPINFKVRGFNAENSYGLKGAKK